MSRYEELVRTVDLIDALENSVDMAETDEERTEIEDRISALFIEQHRSADAFIGTLLRWQKRQEEAKELADKVRDREQVYKNREDRLRKRLATVMQQYGISKAEGLTGVITLRPGSESVELFGEVPAQFCTVTETSKPDKTRIKQALKQGESVPGARLVTGSPVIQVR